uniref:Reverse transcriptase domain-containing protein n=1 Tax=Tanacetum cinerariifolium TaxID=118510 RepID=A0A699KAA6_TANCI|nr:reverse transcriptase domain-containing protein [Tanacetum cinerariifolium]
MASSSGSGTLSSNTVTNPKEDVKGITTEAVLPIKDQQSLLRLRLLNKANEQIEKFHEIFKDMSFEISFTDALILMPKFSSTLKALIRNKEKLSEMARTPMNEHCSAVILNKLPIKLRDPEKFLIPCEFPRMDEYLLEMNEYKGRMQTKNELTLEQSQQGVSNDVLVNIEGVKELKRNVWIKGENKAALQTPLGRNRVDT